MRKAGKTEKEASDVMEAGVRGVLAEMEAWGRDHDRREADHGRRMLNLSPDTADLLSTLVQSGRRTRLLEVGTSNGYSTVWLAWAARRTGGHVVSVERDDEKRRMADENLTRAGLRGAVTLLPGDAREVLAGLDGPFDFVFLDADLRSYPEYLALLLPRLAPDALVTADNAHSHADEIASYLEAVAALPEFRHVVVSVGQGLSIARRGGDGSTKGAADRN